jgi:hypothetical protein
LAEVVFAKIIFAKVVFSKAVFARAVLARVIPGRVTLEGLFLFDTSCRLLGLSKFLLSAWREIFVSLVG